MGTPFFGVECAGEQVAVLPFRIPIFAELKVFPTKTQANLLCRKVFSRKKVGFCHFLCL